MAFSLFMTSTYSSSAFLTKPDFEAMEARYLALIDSLGAENEAVRSATFEYATELHAAGGISTGQRAQRALIESSIYFHLAGDRTKSRKVLREASHAVQSWQSRLLFVDAALALGQRDLARVVASVMIPEAKADTARAAQLAPKLNTLGMNHDVLTIRQVGQSARGYRRPGVDSGAAARQAPLDQRGVEPIPFSAPAFDGGPTISISQYRGKVVVLDFWATWCGPCMRELPMVKNMHEDLSCDGLVVIGISLDKNESDLRRAIEKYGVDWPQVFDGQGWSAAVAEQYGVRSIPHTVLISRAGRVVARGLRGGQLRQAVEAELAR